MTVIFIIILALFLVLLGWMWNSLGNIRENNKNNLHNWRINNCIYYNIYNIQYI